MLPPEVATALLARCVVAQSALTTRLLASAAANGPAPAPEADRLLTPKAASAILGVTSTWLYRHAGRLPFTRRLSRKVLRFSQAGLQRWQTRQRP
jgi:predicted DNA-binding transcriptional regulator AlpA